MSVSLYRYRTETLVGPWRRSRLEAETDAVAAGQAYLNGRRGNDLVWKVPGEIEMRGTGDAKAK